MGIVESKLLYLAFAIVCTFLIQGISLAFYHPIVTSNGVKINSFLKITGFLVLLLVVEVFCAFRTISPTQGGTDAIAYYNQFMDSRTGLLEHMKAYKDWEPLHSLCLWIVHTIWPNYRVFLVLAYLLFTISLVKYASMFRLDKVSFLSTLALMFLFLESLNTQRNIFAAFMGFFVLDAILKRQYLRGVLISVALCGFHISAAILLMIIVVIFVLKHLQGRYNLILFFLIGLMIGGALFVVRIVPLLIRGTRLTFYSSELSISFAMLATYGIMFVCHYYFSHYSQRDRLTRDISTFYLCFAPTFVFQMFYPIAYRIFLYSLPVLYILLWRWKRLFVLEKSWLRGLLFFGADILLVMRIYSFFTQMFANIGVYSNVLFGG